MGPLSTLVVTSYEFPTVIIGLPLTIIAVLQLVTDRRTDGHTDGTSLAKGGTMH